MTDPWQDYLTALKGLVGIEERVAARSKQAEVLLNERLACAGNESQRMFTDLGRAQRVVGAAATDLERVCQSLGVEITAQDPADSIRTIDQARTVAVAASQWAGQADATLKSLQRTEQRLAQTSKPQVALTPPARRSRRPVLLVGILVAVVLLLGVGALALV